jgi:uncharacterized 2Fe-2S/4Fe-4S cluster protein (DUF4445 family)
MVSIRLVPLGKTLEVPRGTPLRNVLFEVGVEYPCGGRGECRGCRVRLISGDLPATERQTHQLKPAEVDAGWRLSCQCRADADLTLELGRWNADVLVDQSSFEFKPREGHGIAIDLGTTTVVAQLLDLGSSDVLAVRSALNSQARHGADVMSRIGYAVEPGGLETLSGLIRSQIGKMIAGLIEDATDSSGKIPEVVEVAIVGNTAMAHLFAGIDAAPLSAYPFDPGPCRDLAFSQHDLGWENLKGARIRFLPWMGGFVGSDVLAGMVATGLHTSERPTALVDLGTNGEIVVASAGRFLCASTAAGPAFEGAAIHQGMRAATGAIYKVEATSSGVVCKVLGDGNPRGLCGSGLVDALAAGLETGAIQPRGRFADKSQEWPLLDPVVLTQTDIRQVQLAKGAITAGLRILSARAGLTLADLDRVHLAGAFGNTIDRESARRIGLLPFPSEQIHPVGNAALLGAKMALFGGEELGRTLEAILSRCEHFSLSADPEFQDIYAEEMLFPEP